MCGCECVDQTINRKNVLTLEVIDVAGNEYDKMSESRYTNIDRSIKRTEALHTIGVGCDNVITICYVLGSTDCLIFLPGMR